MTKTQKELLGHPTGLFVLFFTELWERFSYYGMRAILVLYLVSQTTGENPGLGWDKADALVLYGWYTMLVYVFSIPGGYLADNVFGQKKAVMIGGWTLVAGHSILAVQEMWAFYLGLALIIIGVGLLKPNISTMVGQLYEPGDERRDKGFTIFYIGINIGAFLAALVVGAVGEKIGWHYGFGLAGIGMAVAQIIYVWGQRYLAGIGDLIKKAKDTARKNIHNQPLTKEEKDRIIVIIISFLIVIVFWGAFEQAGGLMNIYTKEKINRVLFGFEVPASWFQSLNPLFIILLGSPIASFWVWWKHKGKEASSLFKMAVGTMIMGAGFLFMVGAADQCMKSGIDSACASMWWVFFAYLFHTVGELSASPVALSFITKLAPAKYASLMMGLYFATTGLGNKVAGMIGEHSESLGELQTFLYIALFTISFGALIILFLKPLKKLTHGADD